jgi:DNA-binding MarR family transcriptional regulator
VLSEAVSVDAVVAAFNQFTRVLHAEHARRGAGPLNDCPMSLPQLRALSLIAASERGLSGRDLAATLGVGASAITPLVDRLVERGFVLRTEDAHDRRIARLHATESGARLLAGMHGVREDVLRDALAQLSPQDLETVSASVDLLCTAVRHLSAPDPHTPPTSQGLPT